MYPRTRSNTNTHIVCMIRNLVSDVLLLFSWCVYVCLSKICGNIIEYQTQSTNAPSEFIHGCGSYYWVWAVVLSHFLFCYRHCRRMFMGLFSFCSFHIFHFLINFIFFFAVKVINISSSVTSPSPPILRSHKMNRRPKHGKGTQTKIYRHCQKARVENTIALYL